MVRRRATHDRGRPRRHVPGSFQEHFVDLPLLRRRLYISEILAGFQCPLQVVRLLKLSPGSNIREHRDYHLSYEDGEVRIP